MVVQPAAWARDMERGRGEYTGSIRFNVKRSGKKHNTNVNNIIGNAEFFLIT